MRREKRERKKESKKVKQEKKSGPKDQWKKEGNKHARYKYKTFILQLASDIAFACPHWLRWTVANSTMDIEGKHPGRCHTLDTASFTQSLSLSLSLSLLISSKMCLQYSLTTYTSCTTCITFTSFTTCMGLTGCTMLKGGHTHTHTRRERERERERERHTQLTF